MTRSGFALLLSLVVVSFLILCLLTLSAFLTLETRNLINAKDSAQAKLHALMAARLALGHLQQTAGPDQRTTATGEFAGLAESSTSENPPTDLPSSDLIGQAYWTGVWRTDKPNEPPAWLISGKNTFAKPSTNIPGGILAQSYHLADTQDYLTSQWTPWQKNPEDSQSWVVLVNAKPLENEVNSNKPTKEGQVLLPKRPFSDDSQKGLGFFAYWISDEGVKARVSSDDFLSNKTNEATVSLFRLHHHTLYSAGVLADSYRGGLRRDLSLAFEMDDEDFDSSGFGSGTSDVIELYTIPTTLEGSPLRKTRSSRFPTFPTGKVGTLESPDPRPRVWIPLYEKNPDNPGRFLGTTGTHYLPWSPIYIREDEMGQTPAESPIVSPVVGLATSPQGTRRRLLGPLWHLLRDYYRLYKEIEWYNQVPLLEARSFYPNTDQFLQGGYRPSLSINPYSNYNLDYGYWPNGGSTSSSAQYLDNEGGTPDPLGWINGRKENRFIPRAVRGAYLPALHRLSLVFSVQKQSVEADYALKILGTPLIVLHNPYNIRLKLKASRSPEPDSRLQGYGARIGFSLLDGLCIYLKSHQGNNAANPLWETTAVAIDDLFQMQKNEVAKKTENFSCIIPETVLEPGEFAVYSAKEAIDVATSSRLPVLVKLERGLYLTGGLRADLKSYQCVESTGNPDGRTRFLWRRFNAEDTLQTWLRIRPNTYWHHWFYLNSGWKQNRAQDRVGPMLEAEEFLGTDRSNSRASYGLMINVGTAFAQQPSDFFGDPGNEKNPVIIGPLHRLRDALTEKDKPGAVVGVIDSQMRVADSVRQTTYDRGIRPWIVAQNQPTPACNPPWLFSNPLAQCSTAAAQNGMPGIGGASLRTQIYGGDELLLNGSTSSWSNFFQVDLNLHPDGGNAWGGYSHQSNSVSRFSPVSIPRQPLVSLGQLMHANLSVWEWFPYYNVGNSFPNLVCPLDKSWTYGTPAYQGGHTFADNSFLLNQALWDSFYFSGATPELEELKNGDYNQVRRTTTMERLEGFAQGTSHLSNQHFHLYQSNQNETVLSIFRRPGFVQRRQAGEPPDGYRRLASYLLSEGAFNINSTSPEAWRVFLLTQLKKPLSRSERWEGQKPAAGDIRDSSYWNGFTLLTEKEITALAESIVLEIKARTQFHQRTERDQEYPPSQRRFLDFPKNQNPRTPFLGLHEFVNRFLGPTKKLGARYTNSFYPLNPTASETPTPYPVPLLGWNNANDYRWSFRSGTLESSLARSDKIFGTRFTAPPNGSFIINPSVSHHWQYGAGSGRQSGMPPGNYLGNIQVFDHENRPRTHNGFGASGCLFQGDLLSILGPKLASRSDTFTLRAYGESAIAGKRTTSAVLEMIVQRTPEYMDTTQPPWIGLSSAEHSPVNHLLGRRFVVLSCRWLSTQDL